MNKKQQKSKQLQPSKQSPTKNSKKQKSPSQSNILDTMKHEIDFLMEFTTSEIQFMFDNYDVIVFQRGMVLAKEKQLVDFVGVIVNGGAIAEKSKAKLKPNSVIGHSVSVFGLQNHRHPETIIAESDGIMFAVRIETLLSPSKQEVEQSVKSKIINFISKETLCHFKKQKHFSSILSAEFEVLDQKLSQKYIQSSKLLSQLIETSSDPKQRQKFLEEFPIYSAKQKTLVASRHSRPFLLLLLKGEIIIKQGLGLKKETKILQCNNLYNPEGFIFDHNQFSNLYCGSSEAVFIIVDKQILTNNFKLTTVSGVMRYCLENVQRVNQYAWGNLIPADDQGVVVGKKDIWSPFRKSFNIQQIPMKSSSLKPGAKQSTNAKKKQSINVFQTLYQTYSTQFKNKLHSKQTQLTQYKETGAQRGHTSTVLKTQYSFEEKGNSTGSSEKLKKLEAEIVTLKQQILDLTETIRRCKLDALESQARLKMNEVLRQIKNLKGFKQHQDHQEMTQEKNEGKSVTLKEAFELHLKKKKLDLLVAKCAYKWLSITRENRNKRENQSSVSLISNTMQKSILSTSGQL